MPRQQAMQGNKGTMYRQTLYYQNTKPKQSRATLLRPGAKLRSQHSKSKLLVADL